MKRILSLLLCLTLSVTTVSATVDLSDDKIVITGETIHRSNYIGGYYSTAAFIPKTVDYRGNCPGVDCGQQFNWTIPVVVDIGGGSSMFEPLSSLKTTLYHAGSLSPQYGYYLSVSVKQFNGSLSSTMELVPTIRQYTKYTVGTATPITLYGFLKHTTPTLCKYCGYNIASSYPTVIVAGPNGAYNTNGGGPIRYYYPNPAISTQTSTVYTTRATQYFSATILKDCVTKGVDLPFSSREVIIDGGTYSGSPAPGKEDWQC